MTVNNLTALLEPLLTVVMGVGVGIMVISPLPSDVRLHQVDPQLVVRPRAPTDPLAHCRWESAPYRGSFSRCSVSRRYVDRDSKPNGQNRDGRRQKNISNFKDVDCC